MNPAKFDDCLLEVQRYLKDQTDVKSAMMYGSVALGKARPDSDLDLMIIAPRDRHEDLARDLFRIGARHDVTVSPYLVELTELEGLDPQFREVVTQDGVVLKGKQLAFTSDSHS